MTDKQEKALYIARQLLDAGISPGLIRFSVGLENIDDILEDIQRGFYSI